MRGEGVGSRVEFFSPFRVFMFSFRLVNFFISITRLQETINSVLGICSSVEKHLSNSQCYHAYVENRLAYVNLENFLSRSVIDKIERIVEICGEIML